MTWNKWKSSKTHPKQTLTVKQMKWWLNNPTPHPLGYWFCLNFLYYIHINLTSFSKIIQNFKIYIYIHIHTQRHTHTCICIHMRVYSICIYMCIISIIIYISTAILMLKDARIMWAALQRCYHKNAPWRIPPNQQENTQAEMRPQQSRHAALLKLHSNAGASTQTNPQKHSPKEHPQRTARAYIQKSKLIWDNNFWKISKIP